MDVKVERGSSRECQEVVVVVVVVEVVVGGGGGGSVGREIGVEKEGAGRGREDTT